MYCDNHTCGRKITRNNPIVATARFVWGELIFCKTCEGE
jgi:hypothetical protein